MDINLIEEYEPKNFGCLHEADAHWMLCDNCSKNLDRELDDLRSSVDAEKNIRLEFNKTINYLDSKVADLTEKLDDAQKEVSRLFGYVTDLGGNPFKITGEDVKKLRS